MNPDTPQDRESDGALFQRIASGDALAFRQLTDSHLAMIVTYASRIVQSQAEAEDVAQETFLRAWQKAASYEPRARARTWLLAIAHNLAIDRIRRRKSRAETGDEGLETEDVPSSTEPARLLARKESAEAVRAAISKLPERQRAALLLCHEQGLQGTEIAKVLGVSAEAVESLLSRARRTLRELLSTPSV